MSKRKIIKIDEEKCNGCGLCIPNCPEGALQIIDKKVRLVSDLVCDGLGACLGHCPQGAISIEEREAVPYDERKAMETISKAGVNTIMAHLKHLKEHGEHGYLNTALAFLKEKNISLSMAENSKKHSPSGCPGSRMIDMGKRNSLPENRSNGTGHPSELRQWPIQLTLVGSSAPYFKDADILIAADCVPFAYPDFHRDLLAGKTLIVGCPKLDDLTSYEEKLTGIFSLNNIKSITYAHMEVPCCFGLVNVIESAIAACGKKIAFKDVTVTISGELRK